MKKLIFGLMMICMILMSSGVVWADVMPPMKPYNAGQGSLLVSPPQKPNSPTYFGDFLGEGFKIFSMVTFVALLLYIVLSLMLVIMKINQKSNVEIKNNSKLESIYWKISGCLSVMLFLRIIMSYPVDLIYYAIVTFVISFGAYVYSYIRKDKKLLHKNITRVILVALIVIFLTHDVVPLMTGKIFEYFILFWVISHNFVYHENTKKGLLKNIIISLLTFIIVNICEMNYFFEFICFCLTVSAIILKLFEKKINSEKFSTILREILENVFVCVLMNVIAISTANYIGRIVSSIV